MQANYTLLEETTIKQVPTHIPVPTLFRKIIEIELLDPLKKRLFSNSTQPNNMKKSKKWCPSFLKYLEKIPTE